MYFALWNLCSCREKSVSCGECKLKSAHTHKQMILKEPVHSLKCFQSQSPTAKLYIIFSQNVIYCKTPVSSGRKHSLCWNGSTQNSVMHSLNNVPLFRPADQHFAFAKQTNDSEILRHRKQQTIVVRRARRWAWTPQSIHVSFHFSEFPKLNRLSSMQNFDLWVNWTLWNQVLPLLFAPSIILNKH